MKKLFLVLLVFFALVGSASAVLDDARLFYSFDNSDLTASNPIDVSGVNTLGTNNGATTGVTGVLNQAFDFELSDSDYVDVNNVSSIPWGTNEFTLGAWIKVESTSTFNTIIGSQENGGGGGIVLWLNSGNLQFVKVGTAGTLTHTYTPSTTAFEFVVAVQNSTGMYLYLNGSQVASNANTLNVVQGGATKVFVGARPLASVSIDSYFDGVIEMPFIYHRALNETEISNLYNSGNGLNPYSAGAGNFSVTVTDGWSGASVSNVTVALANGTSFTNSTGNIVELDVLLNESVLLNFSVLANSGDYFNRSYVNYNLSSNLGATLNQSSIFFNASELFTNNSLSNVTFTISANTDNPKGLSIGNYTVTASKTGYFDKTFDFEVFPLDNKTITVTGMSDTLLNITAQTIINGTSISSFSGWAYNDDLGINVSIDTNTSFYEASVLTGNYTLFLQALNHADTFFNVTVDDQLENVTVPMYTNNSLNVSLYDVDTLSLINVAANISFVGSSVSYNKSTSNGLTFIDYMNDDTYEITVDALGYETSNLFVTVGPNTHETVNFYLTQTATEVDFIVRGNDPTAATNLIENATLTFSRNINGSIIVVGQTSTDFSGRASIFLDPTVTYILSVSASGFNSFTGSVKPTQSEYSVTLIRTVTGFVESQFSDLLVTNTLFSYNNTTTQVVTNYTINSPTGSLQYFGLTSTFDGNTYTQNITGSPGGGTPSINFSVNTSINNTVVVTYFYKLTNSSEQSWSETYFVSDVNAQGTSLPGFINELSSASGAVKGLVGAFIVVFFVVLFAITRNLSVITVSGLIGVFINYTYGLWPNILSLIVLVVGIILLISDNVGGRG